MMIEDEDDGGVLLDDDYREPSPSEWTGSIEMLDDDAIGDDREVIPGHENCPPGCPVCDGEGVDVFPLKLPEPEPEGPLIEEVWDWDEAERYLNAHAPWWRLTEEIPPPSTVAFNQAGWCRSDLDRWIKRFDPMKSDDL